MPAGTGGELPFPYSPIRVPAVLAAGQPIQLGPEVVEALQFRQVNVKEAFTLQDAAGTFFRASLRAAEPEGGEAFVYEAMAQSPESPLRLSLCCAVLARQRMIFVSQKATELGIERLQPVLTERSVPPEGLEHEKAHAWPGQAIRAAKQCRRASVPQVLPPIPLAEVLAGELWRGAEARFYLDHGAPARAGLERGPASACLAVGPEGGWTDAEREQLAAAGAAPLLLGGRVLRAETAVVVGLALLQHHLGDLLA
jgi:16S rRNA (uracil1498-N3)-methyltransferase